MTETEYIKTQHRQDHHYPTTTGIGHASKTQGRTDTTAEEVKEKETTTTASGRGHARDHGRHTRKSATMTRNAGNAAEIETDRIETAMETEEAGAEEIEAETITAITNQDAIPALALHHRSATATTPLNANALLLYHRAPSQQHLHPPPPHLAQTTTESET